MSLADAVKALRRERGAGRGRDLTQQEVADAMTVATGKLWRQQTVGNVEAGAHENPTERLVNALAAGFGISPEELRHRAGLGTPPRREDTVARLRQLGIPEADLADLERIAPRLGPTAWHLAVRFLEALAPEHGPEPRRQMPPADVPEEPEERPPADDRVAATRRGDWGERIAV